MKPRVAHLVFVISALAVLSSSAHAQPRRSDRVFVVKPAGNLADIVARAPDSSTIVVVGEHWLTPRPYVDSTCGNCEDPNTLVNATVGLVVSGRAKTIIGTSPGASVIHTRAGYGVLFENCTRCVIESLSVTDGARDADGNATDAAIVVKQSSVVVFGNRIRDNIGDSSIVRRVTVGVMGVTGREGSLVKVVQNDIVRNSWDGIALYRDARAFIDANFIDGVDLARGDAVGGGRGVGIGLTWNAWADVSYNLVRRYWKGIGVFVDATAYIRGNVVEDVATWGISVWDADNGDARADIRRNVVFRSGACGAAIISGEEAGDSSAAAGGPRATTPTPESIEEDAGQVQVRVRVAAKDEWEWKTEAERRAEREADLKALRASFSGNAFVMTGQNPKYDSGEPYCFQQAVALHKTPPGFAEAGTIFYQNREPGDKPGKRDMDRRSFLAAVADLERELRLSPPIARSEFLKWLEAERSK